jgi:methionine sulfoxide reductase heme-binding subunit
MHATRCRWIKSAVFFFCILPVVFLAREAFREWNDSIVRLAVRATGDWALNFLILTLAVTPLRSIFGWHELLRFRRMLGLFAFFYASLHVAAFRLHHTPEVVQRNIWNLRVAFVAFVLLVPLAVTSASGWMQRLGGRRWRTLHRLVYGIGIIGVVHSWGFAAQEPRKPVLYASIVAFLLLFRLRKLCAGNTSSHRLRNSQLRGTVSFQGRDES